MEEIEKVDTSTPQNDGNDLVNTSNEEKVENNTGFDNITDEELEQKEEGSAEEKEEPVKQDKKVEKTYSQAEFEKVLEKRLARLTAQHKKELADLENRYKSGDYSPEIKSLQDQLNASNQKNIELQNEIVRYEIETAFTKLDVKEEFREFVEYKVLRMVTEEKNFEKCLKEFKAEKENSQYFNTTGGKSIVPPRPNNSNQNSEIIAGENRLKKAMGI